MSTTITSDNAETVLRSAISAAKSEIPDTSSSDYAYDMAIQRKEVEDAYCKVWDKILDCYELSATIRDKSPLPFLLDPDGAVVVEMENAENLLRRELGKLVSNRKENEKVKKVIEAAIDILQNLRWEIMINDGIVEKGEGEYSDARAFMASMGL